MKGWMLSEFYLIILFIAKCDFIAFSLWGFFKNCFRKKVWKVKKRKSRISKPLLQSVTRIISCGIYYTVKRHTFPQLNSQCFFTYVLILLLVFGLLSFIMSLFTFRYAKPMKQFVADTSDLSSLRKNTCMKYLNNEPA